jgi:hypothetical protein
MSILRGRPRIVVVTFDQKIGRLFKAKLVLNRHVIFTVSLRQIVKNNKKKTRGLPRGVGTFRG